MPACASAGGGAGSDEGSGRPRPFPPVPKKLDGEKEARLVQVACSVPPEGRVRWTVLLAEELVRLLKWSESICEETVRQALKKTN